MRNTNKIKLIFIIFLWVTFTAIARWQVPSNVTTYDSLFQSNGSKYGVDPILLKAQIAAESRFINHTKANKVGALGIAQFMPGTAKEWGLKDRTNIPDSLDAQARYMAYMLKKFNGDYVKALAGYNWGPNRKLLKNSDNGTDLMQLFPEETRNYVYRIAQAYIEYGGNGSFLKFAQKILGTDKAYADTGTSNNSNPSSANSCSIADPSEFLSDSDGYGSLPEAALGDYATMSPLEMILTEADRRLGSDSWSKKVTQVSSRALWLDLTKAMAAENYLRRLNFEKRENIEAMMANLVAIKLENAQLALAQSQSMAEQNHIADKIQ